MDPNGLWYQADNAVGPGLWYQVDNAWYRAVSSSATAPFLGRYLVQAGK